jgi:hypothetical protein
MTKEQRANQCHSILLEYEKGLRDHDSALQGLLALGSHPVDAAELLAIARGEPQKRDQILHEYAEKRLDHESAFQGLVALGTPPNEVEIWPSTARGERPKFGSSSV